MKYSLLLIFVSIFFFTCKNENQKKIFIVTKDYKNKVKSIDSTYLQITKKDQKYIYNYGYKFKDSVTTRFIYLEKIIDDNNYLRVFNENSIIVDSMSFLFEGQKAKVYKYLYDELSVEDDKIDYYFNEKLGLIFAKDLAWNLNTYFDIDNLKQLHDSILKNEDKFKSSFNFKTKIED